MAKSRAEREAEFRAQHGVSSGTYYSMRRKAESRGIDPKDFDRVAQIKAGREGYTFAKQITQVAKSNPVTARKMGNLLIDESTLPKGKKQRKDFMKQLGAEWRDVGGDFDAFIQAMGSPRKSPGAAR